MEPFSSYGLKSSKTESPAGDKVYVGVENLGTVKEEG